MMLNSVVLPAPFGADNGEDRALRHGKADAVDREQTAEALADRLDGEECGHFFSPVRPSRRASGGHTPSGSARTTRRRQTP